jgi:lipopolysaccharide/colanic/teichoic acid biosynthesis glycosyltransferase
MLDLTCVAVSPLIALLIRDNFATSVFRLKAVAPYALLCLLGAMIVFSVLRLHHSLWRYTSLNDILRVIAAVTIVLLIALTASFHLNRMENVARSLPVIQWFLLVAAMSATRIIIRLSGEWAGRRRRQSDQITPRVEHVLIVGVSDVTELYLRSVEEFAHGRLAVVGILARGKQMHGRMLRAQKVLGEPENIQQVLSELEVHGISVERIAVMQPFEQLSKDAQNALLAVERSSTIRVDYLLERLGFLEDGASDMPAAVTNASLSDMQPPLREETDFSPVERYHYTKRVTDCAAAIVVTLALVPVLTIVALLVAIDVGFPLVFWQQRPGRYGRRFKLFKFRTMRASHDAHGKRVPDQLRSSIIGDFLRRSHLDELPQLYNILVGEMSFVGPRPLLLTDQPQCSKLRLLVRPGLTGWAQVNGGRDISADDKDALDIWYVRNASLWLDTVIFFRTFGVVVFGERVNVNALNDAHSMLLKAKALKGAPNRGTGLVTPAGGARATG